MLLALNPDLLGDKAVCAGVWRTCPALWRSGARLAARVVVSRCKSGFGLGFFLVFDWVFMEGWGVLGFFWQNSWHFLVSMWAAVGDV